MPFRFLSAFLLTPLLYVSVLSDGIKIVKGALYSVNSNDCVMNGVANSLGLMDGRDLLVIALGESPKNQQFTHARRLWKVAIISNELPNDPRARPLEPYIPEDPNTPNEKIWMTAELAWVEKLRKPDQRRPYFLKPKNLRELMNEIGRYQEMYGRPTEDSYVQPSQSSRQQPPPPLVQVPHSQPPGSESQRGLSHQELSRLQALHQISQQPRIAQHPSQGSHLQQPGPQPGLDRQHGPRPPAPGPAEYQPFQPQYPDHAAYLQRPSEMAHHSHQPFPGHALSQAPQQQLPQRMDQEDLGHGNMEWPSVFGHGLGEAIDQSTEDPTTT